VLTAILGLGMSAAASRANRWSAPQAISGGQPVGVAVDEEGRAAFLTLGPSLGASLQLHYGRLRSPRKITSIAESANWATLGLAANGRVLIAWTGYPAPKDALGEGAYMTTVGTDGTTTRVVAHPTWQVRRLEFFSGRPLLDVWAPETPGAIAFTYSARRFVQVKEGPFTEGVDVGYSTGITGRGYGLKVSAQTDGDISVARAGPRETDFGPPVTLRWAHPTGGPRIGPAANGGLVVYWEEGSTLWLASFGSTGLPRGPVRSRNVPELPYTPYGGEQLDAQLVGDVGGGAYVLWRGTWPNAAMRVARMSRHGGLGRIHVLATGDAEGGPYRPLLAANSHGQAIATWIDYHTNQPSFATLGADVTRKSRTPR
jgi:hypothetical protein